MELAHDNAIKCIPVFQNQQEFLIGVFKIGTILRFTKYTKRLIIGYKENNEPEYNPQIQREIEPSRVSKIADFLIEDPNATFPTNIVLHIPTIVIDKQVKKDGFIELSLNEKVYEGVKRESKQEDAGDIYITIIDGQHRIRGIEEALSVIDKDIKEINKTLFLNKDNVELNLRLDKLSKRKIDLLNIELVVSFFVDKTLEYQAMIFSTINRTQKRVSESLVYSLFGLNTLDSPQKTALQIVLALNAHERSPFYNRVNLYGGEYDRNQSPPLSQATMVKSIIDLICENLKESEKDRFKERKTLQNRTPGSNKYLPFRRYYAANQDKKIADILFYYFKAVRETFVYSEEYLWDFRPENMKPSNLLHTTVGYIAFLDILIDILKELNEEQKYDTKYYSTYLHKAALKLNLRNIERYPFTSKSQTILYLDLSLAIWPADNNFDKRILKLNELVNKTA